MIITFLNIKNLIFIKFYTLGQNVNQVLNAIKGSLNK